MLDFIHKLFLQKKELKKPKILIFCGAGISAESGLSTFRDSNGLWNSYNPSEICNLKNFHKNRNIVFDFYNQRKKEIMNAVPNSAHFFLANLQQTYGLNNVHIFTSNIDDLLDKAGCKNVIYVHGNCQNMQCLECQHTWYIGNDFFNINATCPTCFSNNIKPHIIFFNEKSTKYKALQQAFESSGEIINNQIVPNIKLIIGTSFNVIDTSVFLPKRGQSILLDLNPNDNVQKEFDITIKKFATLGIIEVENIIKTWYKLK